MRLYAKFILSPVFEDDSMVKKIGHCPAVLIILGRNQSACGGGTLLTRLYGSLEFRIIRLWGDWFYFSKPGTE